MSVKILLTHKPIPLKEALHRSQMFFNLIHICPYSYYEENKTCFVLSLGYLFIANYYLFSILIQRKIKHVLKTEKV